MNAHTSTDTLTKPASSYDARAAFLAYNVIASSRPTLSVATTFTEARKAKIEARLKDGGIDNWRRSTRMMATIPLTRTRADGHLKSHTIDDLMGDAMWLQLQGGPMKVPRNRSRSAPQKVVEVSLADEPVFAYVQKPAARPASRMTTLLGAMFGWIKGVGI